MHHIRIAGKKYFIPVHWDDITLSQCAWLHQKVNEQSPEIIDYYKAYTSDTPPQLPANIDQLRRFSAEALGYLSGISDNALMHAPEDDIQRLADAILPRFVLGVLGMVDYPIRGIRSFLHHHRKYHLPKSGIDISGTLTPMSSVSAIELCLLSDIVCSGNIALAPLAVAIACRKKGEAYDEQTAAERAGIFKDLPASVYWELWVLVSGAHEYLKSEYPSCYPKGSTKSAESAEPAVWSDMLVGLATDKPSELEYLQRMNGYDFMHLLSEYIKRETEKWKMKAALASCGVR